MKKLISVILAAVMLLSMSAVSLAADKDTNIKKLDVYTGDEEILINVDDEIALLSEEAEASSDMENIYIDGAQIKQVYYDAERNRVILWLYFNKSRTDGFYTIDGGGLEQIMKEADKISRLCISLPNNQIMSEYYIYDAETGSIISEPGLFHDRDGTRSYTCTYPNNIYYINNTLYYESNSAERRSETGSVVAFNKYDFVESQDIIPNYELNWTSSFAVYGDFIYELDYYNGSINKYTLSGAEREGIEMSDIAVRDGIPNIKGQLMFTADGDMLIFNGNTFRIIKKNG